MNDLKLTKETLSSVNINFLFGSGVNGNALGQFNSFTRTIDFLSKKLGKKVDNLENALDELTLEDDINTARKIFDDEFEEKISKIDMNNNSIKNIKILFFTINKIVEKSENRVDSLKQVNIYTLNYDDIVINILRSMGYFVNLITPTNIDDYKKYYDILGYDTKYKRFVPSYVISKIHGDNKNKILPGKYKFRDDLVSKIYEIIFKMKENLLKDNSLLFVIGYAGNDADINCFIIDAVKKGLTVVWYCYCDADVDKIPEELKEVINIVNVKSEKDSTLKLSEDLEEICQK